MAATMGYGKDARPPPTHREMGPVRKKLKTSDLPLASATRAAIEGLSHTFKKKGGYDSLRKQIWEDLEKSDFETEFSKTLLSVAEEELDKNTEQLLKLERGKATLLIEGAVDRAGVYQSAEARIDALIDAHIEEIESGIRKVRREDIGEEAAAAEQARGSKTDEQYAEEAEMRREERELARTEAREKERAAQDEKRRAERAKRKEEEKRSEDEAEKRRAERDARRKAEREREEEKDKELKEREREREQRERDRGRDRDRDRDTRDKDRDDRYRRHDDSPSRRDSRDLRDSKDVKEAIVKPELSKEEIDRIEQEAINFLVKEGKRISQRSTRHQMEHEIDEALAPPPRKTMPASAIKPISRDSPNVKPEIKIPTGPKADTMFKTPFPPSSRVEDRSDRRRSRSRDRASIRRPSRSRSRHHSRDRESVRSSRRDSRDRDDRRRRDSKDRDGRRRRSSRDRSRSRDRRRSRRSRSRSQDREKREREAARSRERVCAPQYPQPNQLGPPPRTGKLEDWKLAEAKKREQEARAYLAAQNEARAKGLPIPGMWSERKADDVSKAGSPVSVRKRDTSVDRERDSHKDRNSHKDRDRDRDHDRTSRAKSKSRTPTGRRTSQRSTSPPNIDRYVPGVSSSRSHRESTTLKRSGDRSRSRDRDRDRDRDKRSSREERSSRDEDKTRKRSRSRSRSRRRDRDRSRDLERRKRSRTRSRSPRERRERDSRRERSRSRERGRERGRDRRRERSRIRDKDRDHKRERDSSRTREAKRDYRDTRRD